MLNAHSVIHDKRMKYVITTTGHALTMFVSHAQVGKWVMRTMKPQGDGDAPHVTGLWCDERSTIEHLHVCALSCSGDYNVGEISDLESSDDGKGGQQAPKKAKKAGTQYNRGRGVKECPACGAQVQISTKTCAYCDYSFSAKSLVSNVTAEDESANIRERFPFEPERVRFLCVYLFSIHGISSIVVLFVVNDSTGGRWNAEN